MESCWELDRRMPVEIIAEIANAHQGDPRMAATLAERAFAAGADAVKFQVYFADELLVERHPRFAHFRDQAFDVETWAEVIPAAVEQGPVYCDVFGPRALATALELGAAGVKDVAISAGITKIKTVDEALASPWKHLFVAGFDEEIFTVLGTG